VGKTRTLILLVTGLLISLDVSAQSELDLSEIRLPPGFSIEIWSDQVPNARSLALGANGTVFAGTRRDGRVYALMPRDNTSPTVVTLAEPPNYALSGYRSDSA
jgi:hypothetical protein